MHFLCDIFFKYVHRLAFGLDARFDLLLVLDLTFDTSDSCKFAYIGGSVGRGVIISSVINDPFLAALVLELPVFGFQPMARVQMLQPKLNLPQIYLLVWSAFVIALDFPLSV